MKGEYLCIICENNKQSSDGNMYFFGWSQVIHHAFAYLLTTRLAYLVNLTITISEDLFQSITGLLARSPDVSNFSYVYWSEY